MKISRFAYELVYDVCSSNARRAVLVQAIDGRLDGLRSADVFRSILS